ncbi:MAG: hypothetical protein VW518_11715, partial [Burkholderiaceae bacterium]
MGERAGEGRLHLPLNPSLRLGVAALSAILAILVLNQYITRVDMPGFDTLLGVTMVGVAFTV